jgi:YVTN family beta-propeller protein
MLVIASVSLRGAIDGDEASGTLIVLNKSDATASLILLETGEVVRTLGTGIGPHEVAVSPDGKLAVVSNYGGRGQPGSSLTVLDLETGNIQKNISLGNFQRPHGSVFLKDGKRLLVTAEAQKALLLVNVESDSIEMVVKTNQNVSHMVEIDAGQRFGFVSSIGSGSVCIIDLSKGELIKTINTGAGAEGIACSPEGKELWVGNRADDKISIIDIESLAVIENLECGSFPIRIKFTPDGKHALVSNARSGEVAVFDVELRKEVRRISMNVTAVESKEGRLFGSQFEGSPIPVGILIPPDGKYAYVANTNADIVTVIDLKTWEIAKRLVAGREPDGLGYTPISIQQ